VGRGIASQGALENARGGHGVTEALQDLRRPYRMSRQGPRLSCVSVQTGGFEHARGPRNSTTPCQPQRRGARGACLYGEERNRSVGERFVSGFRCEVEGTPGVAGSEGLLGRFPPFACSLVKSACGRRFTPLACQGGRLDEALLANELSDLRIHLARS
jgi:hypothetical protein